MNIKHLNQVELSRRWSLSPRTLERWRWQGTGPAYLKIGGRVVYRLEDVEHYEAESKRERAPQPTRHNGHPIPAEFGYSLNGFTR